MYKDKSDSDGISSFQALTTVIAAQVGNGNLAGIITAIVAGGPWRNFLDVVQCIFLV